LSDDRLIEICFNVEVTSSDRAHLETCQSCESRRSNLVGPLDEIGAAVTQQADDAFPAERLARQRARILQRVDQDGRPGRVIAFPAAHTHDGAAPRLRPARWATVAAAVAASFVVGLLAEHLAHDIPGTRRRTFRAHRFAQRPTTNCSDKSSSRPAASGQPRCDHSTS
jgi:hypothetical protein